VQNPQGGARPIIAGDGHQALKGPRGDRASICFAAQERLQRQIVGAVKALIAEQLVGH
jgi:hypothetical protein